MSLSDYGEIFSTILYVLCAAFGFFIKRLYSRQDKNEQRIEMLEEKLNEHRVEDAATYPTRQELQETIIHLKNDIRGMISSMNGSIQNIENYIRNQKNGS